MQNKAFEVPNHKEESSDSEFYLKHCRKEICKRHIYDVCLCASGHLYLLSEYFKCSLKLYIFIETPG